MSGPKLRKQCVTVSDSTVLVTCYQQLEPNTVRDDDTKLKLVGHAFTTVCVMTSVDKQSTTVNGSNSRSRV